MNRRNLLISGAALAASAPLALVAKPRALTPAEVHAMVARHEPVYVYHQGAELRWVLVVEDELRSCRQAIPGPNGNPYIEPITLRMGNPQIAQRVVYDIECYAERL